MAIVQLMTITVVCAVITLPNGIVLPSTGRDWLSVLYMAMSPAPSRWPGRPGRRPTCRRPAPRSS